MKLHEAIEKVMDDGPTASPSDLAHQVIQLVSKDALEPLLVEHLTRVQRDRTRETERMTFRKLMDREFGGPVSMPSGYDEPASHTLSRLAKERFALADGTVVDWLKATADDHLARISYLRSIQARYNQGVDETVRRHERAIQTIESAGVTCLEEVGEHATL